MADVGPFEKETTYRLLVEVCRHWVVSWWLTHKALPERPAVFWVYSGGSNGIDWGNPPGLKDDPELQPLRRKRIRVTIEIEDH